MNPEYIELIEQLRSTLSKMELALGEIHEAISWADQAGNIVWCNKTFDRWMGQEHIEILGKNIADLLALKIPGEKRVVTWKTLCKTASQKKANVIYQYKRRRHSYLLEIKINPLTFPNGQQMSIIVLQDVTREQHYLSKLQHNEERLRALNKELESFSYSVSHDLRAPLRAIDGFTQALDEDYGGQLNDTAKDYIGRIRAGVARMSQLIEDMLLLSRVSRADVTLEPVNLSEMVRSICDGLQARNAARRAEFNIEPDLMAEGDAKLLPIVLENLLGNAWKFTQTRDVTQITFGVTYDKANKPIYFIRDNGVGFDMRYVDKLFGVFQRLHKESEYPGTGVGLATVQRIVHRHGGRVWAESVLDEGATFYFTLC